MHSRTNKVTPPNLLAVTPDQQPSESGCAIVPEIQITPTNCRPKPIPQDGINREVTLVDQIRLPLNLRDRKENKVEADETALNHLFPPLPSHHTLLTALLYNVLSTILSALFLSLILFASILKTFPSIFWVLWSWCRLKDPNRLRPFYQQEKERKHIDSGKLTSGIQYFAERVGLECDEVTIEGEDGFVLTIQHIVDKKPNAVDWKGVFIYALE
jgi:Partial alpha/beta-hydrolase lipase region